MDLFKLPPDKLSQLSNAVRKELNRRVPIDTKGTDAAQLIHGHEAAKRAVVIAATGGHSICFHGGPGFGKTLLRSLAHALGVIES